MVERGKGHIINVSSIAGKEVYPKGAAYCGSKYAVQAITNAQRIELLHYGIKVSSICPERWTPNFHSFVSKGIRRKLMMFIKDLTPFTPKI